MAISINPFFKGLSGSFGDTFTVKNYGGKSVVCKKIGKRKKKASEKQDENEMQFKDANTLAKQIYRDPVLREEARLRLKVPAGTVLYNALVKEFRSKMK